MVVDDVEMVDDVVVEMVMMSIDFEIVEDAECVVGFGEVVDDMFVEVVMMRTMKIVAKKLCL